jgi:hypothetical protein
MFGQENIFPMTDGYDLIGKRKKFIKEKLAEREANAVKKPEIILDNPQAKIDETTHIIKNIVFARDPSNIDMETLSINQRDAFMHENYLNLGELIKRRELMQMGAGESPTSPAAKALRYNRQNTQKQGDINVYRLKDYEDKTLLIESRFESGNLYLAQKVSDTEYNCMMQNDINTSGHTQWFYFRVMNTRAG